MKKVLLMMALAAPVSVLAGEPVEEQQPWSIDVELGAVFTSGNTDQETVNLALDASRSSENWVNTFHVDTLQASQDGDDTADKLYLFYRADYVLNDVSSIFARIAYEDDKFSGFDQQTDFTLGYSRQLYEGEALTVKGDAGIGVKRTEFETGESDSEGLVRLAGDLAWQISESARFTQSLAFEIGQEIKTSRSETALETTISESLALKVAFKVKHSSEVPAGKKKTDTESTISLVYHF